VGEVVLDIEGLTVGFAGPRGVVTAVRGASVAVRRGEVVGVVGESGCGKSTLVRGALRLLPPGGVVLGGAARLLGEDLLTADAATLAARRWRDVAWVPQASLASLNPVLTVGAHFDETLAAHTDLDGAARRAHALALLADVELAPALIDAYPHQLSGGQRQRVVLALALACAPPLLVLDEPTTALDVRVERAILDRVQALQRARGFGVLLVSHDLGLVARVADRVVVMYAGRVVEVVASLAAARHPYTRALLAAAPPSLAATLAGTASAPVPLPGGPPSLTDAPAGCRFHPRCAAAVAACRVGAEPELDASGVACPVVAA
jgi:oligopeptide/dipeptide ABC transporter ATP-binding protein